MIVQQDDFNPEDYPFYETDVYKELEENA